MTGVHRSKRRASGSKPRYSLIAVALALGVALGFGGCRKQASPGAANLNAANKVTLREVSLYYESPRMLLAAERRSVALPENSAAAMPLLVRELMKGPANAQLGRVFPADTVVRGAYLLPGGTVIVDLGGPTLTQGWGTGSHQELMSVYALAQSLTANFADARRVRVLINGTPAETLAGHVSLARSIVPQPGWVEPSSR